MYSITFGIGYILAILVVNVFSSDYHFLSEPNVTVNSPFNFCYKLNFDFLLMEIIVKNISPSVTAVHLKYDVYYQNSFYGLRPFIQRVTVNIEKRTSEVKFMIQKHMKYKHIVVDIELYSQSKICDTTNIAEGRDDTTLISNWENGILVYKDLVNKYYYKNGHCLLPTPCNVVVDLKNKCQEPISCNIEKSLYICTFTKPQNTMTLYQTDEDGSYIGPAPEMKITTTNLIIKLELFDNNTSVKIAITKNKTIWSEELSFTAEDINSDDYVRKRTYSETTDVMYSCQEHKKYATKLHVGFINTTDNKITTLNTPLIQRKFKMADNGTILCCLYYFSGWKDGNKEYITRFVKNKTLLFYESQESISTNLEESKEQKKAPSADWLIYLLYLVPTFLGMSILLLALYMIKQKYCCTNSQRVEETVELDNCATQNQNQVLYANLDFVRDGHQPERQNEESHYANIIGSLRSL